MGFSTGGRKIFRFRIVKIPQGDFWKECNPVRKIIFLCGRLMAPETYVKLPLSKRKW